MKEIEKIKKQNPPITNPWIQPKPQPYQQPYTSPNLPYDPNKTWKINF